jgi:hypothetical protein
MGLIYKTKAGGINEVYDSEGLLAQAEDITAAKTLVQGDSGKVFALNAAAGVAVTLPAVTLSGFCAKFYVKAAFATTDFTIVSATDVIYGSANVNSVSVLAADENTVSFVATAETIGDWIEIMSDGTNWYVSGMAAAAGGITFTAP